jgi:hypothetical protein
MLPSHVGQCLRYDVISSPLLSPIVLGIPHHIHAYACLVHFILQDFTPIIFTEAPVCVSLSFCFGAHFDNIFIFSTDYFDVA